MSEEKPPAAPPTEAPPPTPPPEAPPSRLQKADVFKLFDASPEATPKEIWEKIKDQPPSYALTTIYNFQREWRTLRGLPKGVKPVISVTQKGVPPTPAPPKPPTVSLEASDWANLYGLPHETAAFLLKKPELNLAEERAQLQGKRIAAILEAYQIAVPKSVLILPLFFGALSDYGSLGLNIMDTVKEREKEAKEKEAKKREQGEGSPTSNP